MFVQNSLCNYPKLSKDNLTSRQLCVLLTMSQRQLVYCLTIVCGSLVIIIINTLRFTCVSVRACVTDVGVAVTNLWVACKIITCVPAVSCHRNGYNISRARDSKAAAGRDTQGFRLREGCHCGRLPSH